jgi:glycerate dehydrogenase
MKTWTGSALDRLEELVGFDVFIITARLTPATQGVIGKRLLSLMKENAILINIARGEIIDEDALYEH